MATDRLIGRTTAGAGAAEEISVSSSLSLASGVLGLAATVSIGVDDDTPGNLYLYGGGTGEASGSLRIYNNVDDDTNADYWSFTGEDGTGDLIIGDPGNPDIIRIDETSLDVTIDAGSGLFLTDLPTPTNYTAADDNIVTHLAGIDTALASSGGAQISGTPLNNEVAVWTNSTDIEGAGTLTFDSVVTRLSIGTNDTTPGALWIAGGGTGEESGEIRIYNNVDDDSGTDYWQITGEDGTGDFVVKSATADMFRMQDSVTTCIASFGQDDARPGNLYLYGGGTGEASGELRIYNNADDDSFANYWSFIGEDGTGDLLIGSNSTTAMRFDDAFLEIRMPEGDLFLGANDTTDGHISLYGSNSVTGGRVLFYNGATTDTNTDYWWTGSSSAGDWIVEADGSTETIAVDEADYTVRISQGLLNVGVDDTTPGRLYLYGGGAGEQSGEVRIYNNADDDTNADYYSLYGEDGTGDFILATSRDGGTPCLTIDDSAGASGVSIDIGVDDSVRGILRLFGGGSVEQGGSLRIYNNADDDTNVNFWDIFAQDGTGDLVFSSIGAATALRIRDTIGGGSGNADVDIGLEDSRTGILHLHGGGTGEASGELRIYNNADDDANADYWSIKGEDGTGDLVIGDNGDPDVIRIDESTNNVTIANDCQIDGMTRLGPNTELTIASGAITVTGSYHHVDTESDAATDDLDTINGGTVGDILILRAANGTRDIVLKDGTGNLRLNGDFTMNNLDDHIMLIFSSGGSLWCEISRSDNT